MAYIPCFGQEESIFLRLNNAQNAFQIEQDNLGYIWTTNNSGIYKYNGYDFIFTSYKEIFGNEFLGDREFLLKKDYQNNFWLSSHNGELTKINKNGIKISYKNKITNTKKQLQITAIKPTNKDVWFGANNGSIYKYDYTTQKIDSITSLPNIKNATQKIISIEFINENEIWISTSNGAIFRYSINKNEFKYLKGPFVGLTQNIKLGTDKNGKLWIATESHGLFQYDDKLKTYKQYAQYHKTNLLNYPMFISVFCDTSGIIWAGTDGDGLYKINPETEETTVFKHDEVNNFSISDNTIRSINEDKNGNIWIIDKNGKMNILPKKNSNIHYYNGLKNNTPTKILSILKSSKNGDLWIGTDGKGLNRVLPNKRKLHYDNSKTDNFYFEGKYIQSLLEDVKGNIWIATYQRGLWIYDVKSNTFSQIETKDKSGRNSSDIRFLFKDSKNRIWATSSAAIHVFSANKKPLTSFEYNASGLFGQNSQSICEDEKGNIWIGINNGGLYKFHEDTNNFKSSFFTRYNYYTKIKDDSRNYNIHVLKPDFNGNLWILGASGILLKYNINDSSYEPFDDGFFKDKNFTSIELTNPYNIWLGSTNGLHHFNFTSNKLESFYEIDGLQSNSFRLRSSFRDKQGMLYFGGKYGLNSFLPTRLNKQQTKAKLYINSIEILNKPINVMLPDQIKERIEDLKSLKLESNHTSFSFQFSAIDNVLNSNYNYAYKLNGFDKDWITPKNDRIASYTNIPYGKYTFKVKAGSKKGEWDIESKTIDIYIKPPFLLSPYAYILYVILFSFFIYGLFVWLRLKNKLAKEEWRNKQEKELYALKMNFFAKMSHEIQTPLTLILGPIEDMLERAGVNGNQLLKQRLLIIKNNAKRLSRIATELTTIRNKELGKLRIFASKNNLIDHFKNIALSFKEQARFKNIDFIQQYPEEEINIWYDTDKMEHVIYNLLSNAFKFTPREGTITLKITKVINEDFVEFSIIDSGHGIPKDELDDIFKLFYRSDLGKHTKGFGIGLALTKELISLHKGTIHVISSPESGTTFAVKLSTNDTVFSEDEKIFVDSSKSLKLSLDENIDGLAKEFNLKTKFQSNKTHTLLIVEDNIEMQIFLRDILGKNYTILIAENGKEGVELAKKNIPDLILSDIMMPKMDGIEMCSILQKNRKTSHIPIILLTAKNTTKTKLKGLKSGAIEYLQKPFNFYELLLKINNIIDSKEKLILKYKTQMASAPKESVEKSKDDLFLDQLVNELNSQLDNSDFKLDELAQTLNMSYSVIYRKCQEITGMTLVEFVRSIRMKKGALLIVQQGYNIAEAAFMVGYKDPKYFTKCFKEEFGQTPNKFKSEAKKIGVFELLKKYNLQAVGDTTPLLL